MTFCTPVQIAHLFPPDGMDVIQWRNTMLIRHLYIRDSNCWNCDGHTISSIHEAIITRGDVMGWRPKSRRLEIFNGLNCILLCDRCHNTSHEPAREEVADWMADEYGLDIVLDWLLSLQFKSRHPLEGWIRHNE